MDADTAVKDIWGEKERFEGGVDGAGGVDHCGWGEGVGEGLCISDRDLGGLVWAGDNGAAGGGEKGGKWNER